MKITIEDPREEKQSEDIEINYGDLFEWTEKSEDNFKYNPCMYTYEGLISLSDPMRTWFPGGPVIAHVKKFLKSGDLRKLLKGYKVTLEQE